MSQSRPALPPHRSRAAHAAGAEPPLDGEVIPPTLRLVPPWLDAAAPRPLAAFGLRLGTAALAPALALLLAAGGGGAAFHWRAHWLPASSPSPVAVALAHLAKDVGDLRSAVEAGRKDASAQNLRNSVDALKAELADLRSSEAAAVAQLSGRLDRAAKGDGAGTSEILARLDKLDHDPRLAEMAARLDRIEHQVAAPMPTASIAAPTHTAAALAPTPTPMPVQQTIVAAATRPGKPAALDNWILRDVYAGIALVEGRSGSIREVVPGETLPGAGEVRAIQRHGRNWVVVTSRGIIDDQTW